MGRRATPSRHELASDARHWRRRLADEEEREQMTAAKEGREVTEDDV